MRAILQFKKSEINILVSSKNIENQNVSVTKKNLYKNRQLHFPQVQKGAFVINIIFRMCVFADIIKQFDLFWSFFAQST